MITSFTTLNTFEIMITETEREGWGRKPRRLRPRTLFVLGTALSIPGCVVLRRRESEEGVLADGVVKVNPASNVVQRK